MDGAFYRGSASEQGTRFTDKEKKLLREMKFEKQLETDIDLKKVNIDVIKPWITTKLTSLLGQEDDVVNEYVFSQLEQKQLNPKIMQINMTGFLNARRAREFMGELWELFIEAQSTKDGIPMSLVQKKIEELKASDQKPDDAVAIDLKDTSNNWNNRYQSLTYGKYQPKLETDDGNEDEPPRRRSDSPPKKRDRERSRSPRRRRERERDHSPEKNRPRHRSRSPVDRKPRREKERERKRSPTPEKRKPRRDREQKALSPVEKERKTRRRRSSSSPERKPRRERERSRSPKHRRDRVRSRSPEKRRKRSRSPSKKKKSSKSSHKDKRRDDRDRPSKKKHRHESDKSRSASPEKKFSERSHTPSTD